MSSQEKLTNTNTARKQLSAVRAFLRDVPVIDGNKAKYLLQRIDLAMSEIDKATAQKSKSSQKQNGAGMFDLSLPKANAVTVAQEHVDFIMKELKSVLSTKEIEVYNTYLTNPVDAKLKTENAGLKVENTGLKTDKLKLEAQIAALTTEIQSRKAHLFNLEETQRKLKNQITQENAKSKRLEDTIKQLKKEAELTENRVTSLTTSLEFMKDKLAKKSQRFMQEKMRIKQTAVEYFKTQRAHIAELQGELEAVDAEKQETETQFNLAAEQLADAIKVVDRLRAEKAAAVASDAAKDAELEEVIQERRTTIAQLRLALGRHSRQLENETTAKALAERQLQEQIAALAAVQQQLDQSVATNNQLTEANAQAVATNNQLLAAQAAVLADNQQLLDMVEDRNTQLQRKDEQLNQKDEQLIQRGVEQQANIERLTEQLNKEALIRREQELLELTKRIQLLESQVEEEKAKAKQKNEQANKLHALNQQLAGELNQSSKDKAAAEALNEVRSLEISTLQEQIRQNEAEISRQKEEISNAARLLNDTKNQLSAEYDARAAQLTSEHNNSIAAINQQLEASRQELRAQKSLNKNMRENGNRNAEEISRLRGEIQKLEQVDKTAQDYIDKEVKKQTEKIRGQLRKAQGTIFELEQANEAANKQNEELQTRERRTITTAQSAIRKKIAAFEAEKNKAQQNFEESLRNLTVEKDAAIGALTDVLNMSSEIIRIINEQQDVPILSPNTIQTLTAYLDKCEGYKFNDQLRVTVDNLISRWRFYITKLTDFAVVLAEKEKALSKKDAALSQKDAAYKQKERLLQEQIEEEKLKLDELQTTHKFLQEKNVELTRDLSVLHESIYHNDQVADVAATLKRDGSRTNIVSSINRVTPAPPVVPDSLIRSNTASSSGSFGSVDSFSSNPVNPLLNSPDVPPSNLQLKFGLPNITDDHFNTGAIMVPSAQKYHMRQTQGGNGRFSQSEINDMMLVGLCGLLVFCILLIVYFLIKTIYDSQVKNELTSYNIDHNGYRRTDVGGN